VKGETIPHRNTKVKDQLCYVPEEGVHTVFDLMERSAKKFGDLKALGSRSKISMQIGGGKEDKSELSEYKYTTYLEYESLVMQLGFGLCKLGLSAQRDKVCIYAQTR
jgi:long-chain acyl-CoA synthetase